jgi:hypothetical protein
MALYTAQKTTAVVEYVPVKLSWATKWGVSASQADVEAWARDKANAPLVELEAKKAPHIRHVLAKFPGAKPGATPSEADKAKAKDKIDAAMKRIKAGEPLAAVAKDVSDDTGSAAQGGDVGDKTDGFVEPFKKAADALKPGEMTQAAVETVFGYHIIAKDDPAKTAARELYTKNKALEVAKDLAGKVQAQLKAGKDADDALKELIAPFVKKEKDENKPDAKPAGDGGAASAASTPKPRADTDSDRPQLLKSGAFNKGGDPIQGLAEAANASVLKLAFEAKDGTVLDEVLRTQDGFVVVRLKERKATTKEEFDKERDTFVQTLLAPKQAEALGLFVKRMREGAKNDIKVDDNALLDQKKGDAGAGSPFDDEE